MLKFVAQDSNGLPRKRKHAGNACESCRRRKVIPPAVLHNGKLLIKAQKRCRHHQTAEETTLSAALTQQLSTQDADWSQVTDDVLNDDSSPSTSDPELDPHRSRQDQAKNYSTSCHDIVPTVANASTLAGDISIRPPLHPASHFRSNTSVTLPHASPTSIANTTTPRSYDLGEDSRFVGDLNPEAAFLAATVSPISPQNDVGVWSNRHVGEPNASRTAEARRTSHDPNLLLLTDPKISRLLLPYLQNQCLQLLPNPASFDELCTIYFVEIDPIFPILDRTNSWMFSDQTTAKILLKQAVCLAASISPRAQKHLSLGSSGRLSYRDFSSQLVRAINTSITLGLVKEKVVNIQVMALLSLFSQFSDERESSADWHSRAVSLGHTIGIHLRSQGERNDQQYLTRLFCCLWALDRLNAACHGRPTLMHDRDFGHNLDVIFPQQEGCFYLLLRVVQLLDQVIALYRPANTGLPWDKFPSFEDLVLATGALRVASQLLATIEALYHAVAMLSCRTRETESDPFGAAHGRHNLSAVKLTMIVGDEFHGQLSFFPWVPYALSLSLRAAYRDLRQSKAPMFRTRARKQLLTNCDLLRGLSVVFPSAKNMVELAEQVIREMDRVYLSMNSAQQNEDSAVRVVPNSSYAPLNASNGAPNSGLLQHTDEPITVDGETSYSSAPIIMDNANLLFDYDPNTFDPSIFEKLPDLDVFEHFDPDFDLEAFDATLGDTVDLSQPYHLNDFIH